MAKFASKYSFNAKGIMYVENNILSVESGENGELIPIAQFLEDFSGKECTISINYAVDEAEA